MVARVSAPMEPEPETKVLPRGNADVAAPPPVEPGGPLQRIGRYEVVQRLGHGGMATVYLGRATGSAGFERVVAIKVIHPHLAAEPEFVEMFLDEARIAAKIHSPHVAGILDLGEDAGNFYMVMEYIDGETLSALLRQLRPRDERLPLAVALQVLADACEGLVAVHNLRDPDGRPYGLVHRDMSPQNLIINFDGWTKIVDFGLVKATGVKNSHTGHLRGKLAYMAPEQARGKAVSASTDLFALGVIFWEMLTGKRLFAGEGDAETLDNVMRCEVPPLRESRPDVPPAVEGLLRRALAREPEDRYQSAEAMLTDVRALLRECGDTSEPRRALGAIMQHHFAEQAKYRMAAIRGASRGDNRPRIRLVAPPSGPLSAAPTAEDSTRGEPPAMPALDGDESTGTRVLIHAAGSGSRSGSREIAEDMASTSRVPTADIRPWKLWLALPLLGAAIAAAVLLFVLPRNEPEPARPAPRSEPAPERTPTPEPPRPKSVVWNFETEPSGASMVIQGAAPEVAAALAGQIEGKVTPLRLVVPYDEDTRLSVVFSKPGHKTVRRSLIPVNNQNFDVELPPEPAPPTVDTVPTTTATQPTKKRPPKHHETKTNPPPETKAGGADELKDEPKFDSSPGKGGK